jgi:hypothetical protein
MTPFVPSVLLAAAVSAGATGLPMAQEQAPMAQAASPDADKIRRRVKDGQKIVVTDDQGRTLSGRIGELSPDALMLLVGRDTTKVPYDRIVSIDRPRDRLWDGALVGLVVGAGIGLAGAVAAASDDSGWGSPDPAQVALVLPPMLGGIGAAIGVGVDAAIRRDSNLYRRTGPTRISLSPALGPRHRSVAISVSW